MVEQISRIRVTFNVAELGDARGEFIRFLAPRTVEALLRILPIDGKTSRWKSEVYFPVPVKLGGEKPITTADAGTIAYWPMGSALCVFTEKMKPYTAVNPVGRIDENLSLFRNARDGMIIHLKKEVP